jgi:hypothetical protein
MGCLNILEKTFGETLLTNYIIIFLYMKVEYGRSSNKLDTLSKILELKLDKITKKRTYYK